MSARYAWKISTETGAPFYVTGETFEDLARILCEGEGASFGTITTVERQEPGYEAPTIEEMLRRTLIGREEEAEARRLATRRHPENVIRACRYPALPCDRICVECSGELD